jgi:hypothetical protein
VDYDAMIRVHIFGSEKGPVKGLPKINEASNLLSEILFLLEIRAPKIRFRKYAY